MRLQATSQMIFTNKELFVLGCVDRVNSETLLFSKYRKWFGALCDNPAKNSANSRCAVTELLYETEQTG